MFPFGNGATTATSSKRIQQYCKCSQTVAARKFVMRMRHTNSFTLSFLISLCLCVFRSRSTVYTSLFSDADECKNNNFITATKSNFMMQKSNLKTSTYNKSIFSFFSSHWSPLFFFSHWLFDAGNVAYLHWFCSLNFTSQTLCRCDCSSYSRPFRLFRLINSILCVSSQINLKMNSVGIVSIEWTHIFVSKTNSLKTMSVACNEPMSFLLSQNRKIFAQISSFAIKTAKFLPTLNFLHQVKKSSLNRNNTEKMEWKSHGNARKTNTVTLVVCWIFLFFMKCTHIFLLTTNNFGKICSFLIL